MEWNIKWTNRLGAICPSEGLRSASFVNRENSLLTKIKIKELPDWSEETDVVGNLEWGRYLYYNIVEISEIRNFSMYFSDEPEIIENWFQDKTIRERIEIKTFERNTMFEAVSSTKIRNAFLNDDKEYIKKSVPNAVMKRYAEIKEILNEVYTNHEQG